MGIDAASWTRLSHLLDEALDRPPAERNAWLEALGPEHEGLKGRLRELLARSAAVETGDFLTTLPKVGAAPDAFASRVGSVGQVVGAYRLLRQIGSGGMGTVWLAERVDGLIRRPIALKLPHLIVARATELAERMARERDILAALDHRSIAKLLDAGVDASGQPFLALEYVDGLPLDEYCRGAAGHPAPTLAGRLALFRQVAEAVAYAHGKLVLHRDLKPANILVTENGGVRLLDFGIAKLLDDGLTKETRLTEMSGRALTPDYASPEQILGQSLTVASDVYSLGVILYELLAEARPYRLKRDSRGALEDAIVQADPPRPSDIAPAARRKALRGDLDTIALRALKKNPSERYATVNALAEDVSRYLSQRPVLAQADSHWYRLRKFMVRNKLAVTAGALIGAALFVGAGVALWQAREARAEQARGESVKKLLTRMFENADPGSVGGKPLSAAQLLLSASREFEAQTATDPRVRAEISNILATSLFRLGEDAESEKLAQRALSEMEKQLPPGDVRTARAHILRAEQLRYRGKTKEARAHLDATVPWLSVLREQKPEEYVNQILVDADISIDDLEYPRAIDLSKQAYAEAVRRLGRVHPTTAYAMTKLSTAYHHAERNAEALVAARDALALTRELFANRPLGPALMDAQVSYANALGAMGEYSQAVGVFHSVIRDATEVYGRDSVEVGSYLQNAAGPMLRAGRIKDGIDAARRALEIRAPQIEAASFNSLAYRNLYSRALLYGRRSTEALSVLAGMQADASKVLGATHPRTLGVRANYALALAWCGREEEATGIAGEVLKAARDKGKAPGFIPLHVSAQLARLAGDGAAAIALGNEALLIQDLEPTDRAEALTELGAAALLKKDQTLAERSFTDALGVLDGIGNRATPLRAEIELGLARLRLAQGRNDEALAMAQSADRFWHEFDAENRAAGEAAYWLGRIQWGAGDIAKARETLQRAAGILAASPRRADRELALSLRNSPR